MIPSLTGVIFLYDLPVSSSVNQYMTYNALNGVLLWREMSIHGYQGVNNQYYNVTPSETDIELNSYHQ